MKTAILLAAAEHHEKAYDLPMPPIMFAVVAGAVLLLSLFICLSWKGISYRH